MCEHVEELRHFLAPLSPGPLGEDDADEVLGLVLACWGELGVPPQGGLTSDKLFRMEQIEWQPPRLTFLIERHGGTVLGSSRAEMQHWSINVESQKVYVSTAGHRQLRPMAPRLNVKPIAKEIASLITNGQDDERLKRFDDGRVRVAIGKVISDHGVFKQTLQGRRKRFRNELEKLIGVEGWEPSRGANTYSRSV